jgi:hypothetical protein
VSARLNVGMITDTGKREWPSSGTPSGMPIPFPNLDSTSNDRSSL